MYSVELITVEYAPHMGVGNLEQLVHCSLYLLFSRERPNSGDSYGLDNHNITMVTKFIMFITITTIYKATIYNDNTTNQMLLSHDVRLCTMCSYTYNLTFQYFINH